MVFEFGHFTLLSSMLDSGDEEGTHVASKDGIEPELVARSVFLVHSRENAEEIAEAQGVIRWLESLGASVVTFDTDILNQNLDMRNPAALRNHLAACDKFMFLATNKAVESIWCNWQLGMADAKFFPNHMAIIPVKDKGQSGFHYRGGNHLNMFPLVQYLDAFVNDKGEYIEEQYSVLSVDDEDGNSVSMPLQEWLYAEGEV